MTNESSMQRPSECRRIGVDTEATEEATGAVATEDEVRPSYLGSSGY